MSMKTWTKSSGRSVLLLAVLSLGACVSVPEQFRGEYPALAPQEVSASNIGQQVRWGGVILDTRPDQSTTCFEVLSRPLSSSMRPVDSDRTLGRFIACKDGFHDPEVFARGREVTLVGTIERLDVRKVGEFDYPYPVVLAGFMSMWPERQDVIIYEYDMFYSPWYWHSPYYHPFPPQRPYRSSRDKGPRVDLPPPGEERAGRDRQ